MDNERIWWSKAMIARFWDNIKNFVDTKANFESPHLTGIPTAPTAPDGTNTDQIATTAFVIKEFQANDALLYKGTIGASADSPTVTSLPASHENGWTYKVVTTGKYAGRDCNIGDMIVCLTTGTTAKDSDWTVVPVSEDLSYLTAITSQEIDEIFTIL